MALDLIVQGENIEIEFDCKLTKAPHKVDYQLNQVVVSKRFDVTMAGHHFLVFN